MDFDRALAMSKIAPDPLYAFLCNAARLAAEVEQSKPAWSRPPKAQDPKTMSQAEYLACGTKTFPIQPSTTPRACLLSHRLINSPPPPSEIVAQRRRSRISRESPIISISLRPPGSMNCEKIRISSRCVPGLIFRRSRRT